MTVKPERPGGFNDYDPTAMYARQELADRIQRVYETFGFAPLETPLVEFMDVLVGEEGTDMSIFAVQRAMSTERPLGLRFDHTVPLARRVAAYLRDLRLPWRRYCFGPVFRGESTGSGRYHQFYQFDADIVGDASLLADAEIIWMMVTVMKELTTHPFVVCWNSRKLLNGLSEKIGVSGTVVDNESGRSTLRATYLFRALDKLEKLGWDAVCEILEKRPENEHDTSALALSPEQIQVVREFLAATGQGSDPLEALDRLKEVLGGTQEGPEGIDDIRQVVRMLKQLGVPDDRHRLNLRIARGLDYYDGLVFETVVHGAEEFGSVYSGGRYNGLVQRFTGSPLPATGTSIGFDRLFSVLQHLKDLPESRQTPLQVLIMDLNTPQESLLSILAALRRAGIPSEIYGGAQRAFKAQMLRAIHLGIPFVVIPGERELAQGIVGVKDVRSREQVHVSIGALADYFRR